MKHCLSGFLLILCTALLAQAQDVDNVRFEQRTDGSLLVDIYYDVTGTNSLPVEVIVEASRDSGATWSLPCTSLTGDVGPGIMPGTNKHVGWDFFADNPYTNGDGFRVRVTAVQNLCGMTVTKDLTLTEDLTCPSGTGRPALNIGASGITLDLGGHTISGDLVNGWLEGVIAENADGFTIRNGTFEGFGIAIVLDKSDNTTIENLTIKNLDIDDHDIPLGGIVAGQSHGLVVRDCQFEFLHVHHKEAVILGSSRNATIDNIELHGGSVGVNFGGSLLLVPSSGLVVNSRFYENTIAGVLVQYTDSARIANNVFESSAISSDPAIPGIVTGITIEENDLHDGPGAIGFRGASDSIISNNDIRNNETGIGMGPSRGCSGDTVGGEECFYASGNVITDNVVLGNDLDLYHCPQCTGNTWARNTFESSEGVETYTADPTTAREFLASVDSAAVSVAADAQLVQVASLAADSLGKSFKWIYIYRSDSQQNQNLFWYQNGRVIDRGAPLDPVGEHQLLITDVWIDSDSALVIADEMGGRAFREEFGLEHIEMGLYQTHSLIWTVHFFAADTTFTADIDVLNQ